MALNENEKIFLADLFEEHLDYIKDLLRRKYVDASDVARHILMIITICKKLDIEIPDRVLEMIEKIVEELKEEKEKKEKEGGDVE